MPAAYMPERVHHQPPVDERQPGREQPAGALGAANGHSAAARAAAG